MTPPISAQWLEAARSTSRRELCRVDSVQDEHGRKVSVFFDGSYVVQTTTARGTGPGETPGLDVAWSVAGPDGSIAHVVAAGEAAQLERMRDDVAKAMGRMR